MSLAIRPLQPGDQVRWSELFKAYIAFYEAKVSDEVIDLTWQRLMSGEGGSMLGLAACRADGRLVGIAHVLFHRSTWSPTWYCYLEDLFVDPAERAQGAGAALIQAVYRESDARRCTRTYWATQEFNARARSLYDKVATKSPFVQYRR
ncbi:MAG: GNAT family N-acetyltransferase [Hyphomicrobiaceae bacterium]|jgi:GNAT superfamily N-acetyltransferase